MSYSETDLINYRLERAKESLEEAKILAQADYEDFRQFTREEIEPLIQKTENFYLTFQNFIH